MRVTIPRPSRCKREIGAPIGSFASTAPGMEHESIANELAFAVHLRTTFFRRFLADETTGGTLTCWEAFKKYGWAMVPLLVANELRGLYVVVEVMGYA